MLFSNETMGVKLCNRRFHVHRERGSHVRMGSIRSIPIFSGEIRLWEKNPPISIQETLTAHRYIDLVLEPVVVALDDNAAKWLQASLKQNV